jgi:hypothetical protein
MRIASLVPLAAAALACAYLAVTAGAATHSGASCTPAYKYCDPGELHAGVHTTRYFLRGMRVSVPGRRWVSLQDSTTEFKLSPPGYSDPSTAPVIRFWIDPHVSTPCTDEVLPINLTTPARALRWMQTNKNFHVTATGRTRIAGHLAALRLDYDVSPNAPKCDPSCPSSCIDYFMFMGGPQPDATDLAPTHTPGIKDGFGTGADDPVRLYLARIGRPAHSHLFMVGVETPNRTDMARLRADATEMLRHLQLPTKLPPRGKR